MGAPELRDLGEGRFALAGEITFETAPALLAAGEAAFGAHRRAEVDLTGVGRADSAALAVLVEWILARRAAGAELRYRNVPAPVRALAGIAELEGLLALAGEG